MKPLALLARKIALELIGEPGSAKEAIIERELSAAVRRCAEKLSERAQAFREPPGYACQQFFVKELMKQAAEIRSEFGVTEEPRG